MKNEHENKMKRFLILSILVIVGRLYDAIATYLYIPDLKNETNILVKILGTGWISIVIFQVILVIVIIYFIYFYIFKYRRIQPIETNLTLKQFASYLYFNNTVSFYKIFYKTPKNKNALFASIGYTVSLTLISVSFIVGTSTTFLLISDSYRNLYKHGIPIILYVLMGIIAIFFAIRFFRYEYEKYNVCQN